MVSQMEIFTLPNSTVHRVCASLKIVFCLLRIQKTMPFDRCLLSILHLSSFYQHPVLLCITILTQFIKFIIYMLFRLI